MQIGSVTTPFGRRPVSYGMLKDQLAAQNVEEGVSVDKWKIYRCLCEARSKFQVTDRALALLNALLSFYPKSELISGDNLVVFPSNAQLSLRAHGMAEQTIRRHIASLVNAGLLIRKDSANGKRFARRSRAGKINEAFGFSLAPLLARASEIEQAAGEIRAEQMLHRQAKENLTICRRDIKKLLTIAEGEEQPGNWNVFETAYLSILTQLPRNPDLKHVTAALNALSDLREALIKQLEKQLKAPKQSGNTLQNERHIQNSESETILEIELSPKGTRSEELGATEQNPTFSDNSKNRGNTKHIEPAGMTLQNGSKTSKNKIFPLAMVLSACPQILDYGPSGEISSWRDLISASMIVASMLQVSSSAFEEACGVLGPENAATAIACLLQRADHVNCAGGYLRELTRRARIGKFSVGPMLIAQFRTQTLGKGRGGHFKDINGSAWHYRTSKIDKIATRSHENSEAASARWAFSPPPTP